MAQHDSIAVPHRVVLRRAVLRRTRARVLSCGTFGQLYIYEWYAILVYVAAACGGPKEFGYFACMQCNFW